MFLRRKLFIVFISVPAPIFSANSFPVLNPNRVLILKMRYEIGKKQCSNKRQIINIKILYICCRHKSLLTNSGKKKKKRNFFLPDAIAIGSYSVPRHGLGQGISSQASVHRADSEISLSLPVWPFET